jgi:hypothetical protein
MGVEVVGNLAHDPVQRVAIRSEQIGGHPFQLPQHVGDPISRRFGTVLVPHHDGDVARLAIGHPAGAVLVMPGRHASRLTKLAALDFHGSGPENDGMAKSDATAGLRSFQMNPS